MTLFITEMPTLLTAAVNEIRKKAKHLELESQCMVGALAVSFTGAGEKPILTVEDFDRTHELLMMRHGFNNVRPLPKRDILNLWDGEYPDPEDFCGGELTDTLRIRVTNKLIQSHYLPEIIALWNQMIGAYTYHRLVD
jgi:hypothetical protein